MENIFRNISYDLSQDLISEGDAELLSLKHHSLMFSIVYICKKDYVGHFCENIGNYIKNTPEPYHFKIINELTKPITEKIFDYVRRFNFFDFLSKFRENIEEMIYFVLIQICGMIRSESKSINYHRKIELFLRNLVITHQGTINMKKTIIRSLMRGEETPLFKCELGYHYFVEEIVIIYSDKNLHAETFNTYFERCCISYWNWFIKRVIKYKSEGIKDCNILMNKVKSLDFDENVYIEFMNIFEQAVMNNNESAVQYLFVNYISRMPEKECMLEKVLSLEITVKTNIIMYLLLQIKNDKLVEVLQYNYFSIIETIVQNVRWHFLFDKIFNELKTNFNTVDYMNLLDILTNSHFIDYSTHISITLHCIKSLPNYIKEYVLEPNYIYQNLLVKPFINGTENLVRILLNFGNARKFQMFLCKSFGVKMLADTIVNGKLEFVETILLEYITSDDIIEVKRYLFYGKVEILVKHFMHTLQFERIIKLMDWLADSLPEEIKKFKFQIPYKYNGLCVRQLIFSPNIKPNCKRFEITTDFLNWCFKDDKSFNSFILNLSLLPTDVIFGNRTISYYEELKTWLQKSELNLIEECIIWYRCTWKEKRILIVTLFNDVFNSKIVTARDWMLNLKSYTSFLDNILPSDDKNNKPLKTMIKETLMSKGIF